MHKIKDNCVQQVEWICDSYQNQVKNLKDIRDYGTSHLSSMKDQYYEQVSKDKLPLDSYSHPSRLKYKL